MLKVVTKSLINSKINKIAILLLQISCLFYLFSCKEIKKNKSHKDVPDSSIAKGKVLAATYCQSCHLLPDPLQADAYTWENGILPAMGPRLGIFNYGFQQYPSNKYDEHLPENYYPDKPLINSLQWQNIIDYYTALSPDTLPEQQRTQTIKPGLAIFEAQIPPYYYPSPAISLTKIDTSVNDLQLLLFDLSGKYLFRYNKQLQITDSVKMDATIVDIDIHNDSIVVCNMNVINPNNGKFGKGQLLHTKAKQITGLDALALFDNLARPVQISSCDLNNDSRTDYIVCEFGHLSGALSWMENSGNKIYTRHVLRDKPGAIKAYIEDYNHDGLPDIWALFSQGDEGIFLFINKGNSKFEERRILQFPAIFGSTYFEFADFNNDGLQDIIYTCGDNADYSMVLKPYHGVYIFLNEGDNRFIQKYFFPVNGCYKGIARDFDKDGDLDIATIAFFADYKNQPGEGFVYLQNEGNFKFTASTNIECNKGRWLTMDAGDLDGDGKTDLVLGNFSIRPSATKPSVDWTKGPSFIFLKNISK